MQQRIIQQKVSIVMRLRNPAVTLLHHFSASPPVLESPTLASTSAGPSGLSGGLTQTFIPERSQPLLACSIQHLVETRYRNTKRCSSESLEKKT